jgi:Glycosyl transferase family 2
VKLVMTLLARDEEDVVEENLIYHLERGVDFVVATDNNSSDATPEILERYQREGHVHLIHEPSTDFAQHIWRTRMARLAATEFGADWVIDNDADEFWWPTEHRDLKALFASQPEHVQAVMARKLNFVPRPDGDEPFYERMLLRDNEGRNLIGRLILPKVAHRGAADVSVGTGSHRITLDGVAPKSHPAPLEILHYSVRNFPSFETRVRNAAQALPDESADDRTGNVSAQYREMIQIWRAGRLRDYYAALTVDEDQAEEEIAAGRLVRDDRLARFFRERAAAAGERA